MLKNKILNNLNLLFILLIWTIIHISFFSINDIIKVADSFAYLQMSYYLKNFSLEWFWTWWFWFLYSLPIAIIDFFINSELLSARIINIILFNIWAIFLYNIWKLYLNKKYNYILIILYFLSPILLHFNIWILSENLYIPIFLGLILFLHSYIKNITIKNTIYLSWIIALLYLVRWEAFIYLWAIFIIWSYLLINKKINFKKFLIIWVTILISFTVFISPYLIHLNSITWEWWLTNKWSSNLRQATLRWQEKMDDDWFEKAVAELTEDKHHLIAWFAWGLKYDKPSTNITFKSYLLDNSYEVGQRWITNQYKLYTKNIPEIILWDWLKLYFNEKSIFNKNYLFLILLFIPLILTIYWFYKIIISKHKDIIIITLPFFIIASIFFTIFFTLNRYFLIFTPVFLIFILYWIQSINLNITFNKYIKILSLLSIVFIYILWLLSYYNSHKLEDNYRQIKQEAWLYLNEKHWNTDLKILERFPIVTYYSWTKQRWITPYTDNLEDLIEYASYNKIDYLIADTQDFKTYRTELNYILDESKKYKWLEIEKTFNKNNEKVILYKIIK